MIFITVGTQCPFDRLIKAADELAPLFENQEIIAQVCGTSYKPKHIQVLDFIAPKDFEAYIQKADLIISHAGMGTILTVSQLQKPLIVFPRLGRLKETRNDHQLATCKMLEQTCVLQVAYDTDELKQKIQLYMNDQLPVMEKIPPFASSQLIDSIKSFIQPSAAFINARVG